MQASTTPTVPKALRESKRVKPFALTGKFPTIARLRTWKTEFMSRVAAASFRGDDLVVTWLQDVEDPAHDLETLRGDPPSYPWPLLNRFVRDALSALSGHGEFANVLARKTNDELRVHKQMLNGRQIYWLLLQFFQTGDAMAQTYHITDLQAVTYPGDENMGVFLDQWKNIADNLVDNLPDATMAGMLLFRIKASIELKSDIDHYNRVDMNHKDHSYDFLISCLTRRSIATRKEQNREREQQAVVQALRSSGVAGAAGAEDDRRPPKDKKAKKEKADKKPKKEKQSKKDKDDSDEDVRAGAAGAKGGGGRGKGEGKRGKRDESRGRSSSAGREPPQPSWRDIHPAWKSKGTICRNSLLGRCDNGKDCKFFHPSESSEMPAGKTSICSFYQDKNRGCTFDSCRDAHLGVGAEAAAWLVKTRKAERSESRSKSKGKGKGKSQSRGSGSGGSGGENGGICFAWKKSGKCMRADACSFKHPKGMEGKGAR